SKFGDVVGKSKFGEPDVPVVSSSKSIGAACTAGGIGAVGAAGTPNIVFADGEDVGTGGGAAPGLGMRAIGFDAPSPASVPGRVPVPVPGFVPVPVPPPSKRSIDAPRPTDRSLGIGTPSGAVARLI